MSSRFKVGDKVELKDPQKRGLGKYADWDYIVTQVLETSKGYMYYLDTSHLPPKYRFGLVAENEIRLVLYA